jgi:hypothetical protein
MQSRVQSRGLRNSLIIASAMLLLSSFGCAFGELRPNDPFQRQYSLEQAQKRYSDLVRWSKFGEAAGFVAPADRAQFVKDMPNFRHIRFTDHESSPWELDEEMRTTTIEVTYMGYSMRTPLEISVHETQVWSREGNGNHWTVKSNFTDLDRLAGN